MKNDSVVELKLYEKDGWYCKFWFDKENKTYCMSFFYGTGRFCPKTEAVIAQAGPTDRMTKLGWNFISSNEANKEVASYVYRARKGKNTEAAAERNSEKKNPAPTKTAESGAEPEKRTVKGLLPPPCGERTRIRVMGAP